MNGLIYGLIRTGEGKKMVVMGEKDSVLKDSFNGICYHAASSLKVCDLSSSNTQCLMDLFPFTKPSSLRNYPVTIGTGDRLGLATPGHIRAIKKFKVHPVLAQQSVRENHQTGRNFKEVIKDVAWAVYQENYQEGFGADGDHLKSLEEVENALDAGVSMVTLDLSEELNSEMFYDSKEMIQQKFKSEIDEGDAEVLLHLFLDKEFSFKGPYGKFSIRFTEEEVKRNVLLFYEAIEFSEEVFEYIRQRSGRKSLIDFEISIDETPFPTSPENHLFFIIALNHNGVRVDSLAPRFIGEFQKGIDYRGEIKSFREQFCQHSLIAQDYGNYKISIHSGSDKFSIFPDIGELAKAGFHLKTAGTSWLESMRLIALMDPRLFKEMHRFALSVFDEASKLYHVTTNLNRIPKLDDLSDQNLPNLLDQDDPRQLFHITYGYLLKSPLREQFLTILTQYEENYWSLLENHIEKHLMFLGVDKNPPQSTLW